MLDGSSLAAPSLLVKRCVGPLCQGRHGASVGPLLAICRSIVEAHGGRLWVSRRAPHGADVRFTVPLWAEQ